MASWGWPYRDVLPRSPGKGDYCQGLQEPLTPHHSRVTVSNPGMPVSSAQWP